MRSVPIAVLMASLCFPVFAADDKLITEMMSTEERAATGVDRLSESEVRALSQWLQNHVSEESEEIVEKTTREVAIETRKSVVEETKREGYKRADPERVEANLVGEFSGWNGRTRFTLDNGQIWEQRRKASMRYAKPVQNPRVIIEKNFMGFYIMDVPAANTEVPVRLVSQPD